MFKQLSKNILAAAVMACASLWAFAENAEALIVNFHDGTTAYYRLASVPVVTFEGTALCVRSAEASDSHEFANVDTFTFGEYVSVEEVDAQGACIFFPDNETVQFVGFTTGTNVTVVDALGRVWYAGIIDTEGAARVDARNFPAGVYVVSTTSGQTLKIVKK